MLYDCETWSLAVREEGNRAIRRIFEPIMDYNKEWTSLQNEELHSFYRLLNIVRVIKLEG